MSLDPRKPYNRAGEKSWESRAWKAADWKGLAEVMAPGIRRIKQRTRWNTRERIYAEDGVKRNGSGPVSPIFPTTASHGDSLVMDMTVEDNLILRDFDRQPFSRNMVLDYRQAEKRAREALDEYSIKTSGKKAASKKHR
ncbi:MAG: hypothetical protein ACLRZZ_04150 [Enterocloster sp.]